MKEHFKQELIKAAKNYVTSLDGNARLSILLVSQKEELIEINIDKVYDKITVTASTGCGETITTVKGGCEKVTTVIGDRENV